MPKILIIEDEVTIRRVLTKILLEESETYIVEEAEDGKSGFEKIKKAFSIEKAFFIFGDRPIGGVSSPIERNRVS